MIDLSTAEARRSDSDVWAPQLEAVYIRRIELILQWFSSFSSQEEEAEILKKLNLRNHRASCVADEINYRKLNNLKTIGDSVLGQVRARVFVTS